MMPRDLALTAVSHYTVSDSVREGYLGRQDRASRNTPGKTDSILVTGGHIIYYIIYFA